MNRNIGVLILRLLLGFTFLMQGYGKVFNWGVENIYQSTFMPYNEYLPEFILRISAYYTSYVELIGGALLVIGLFRSYAMYALGLVLVMVTFGHGLSEAIWDMQHVIYRAIMLIPLLLIPKEWDIFHLDRFVENISSGFSGKK